MRLFGAVLRWLVFFLAVALHLVVLYAPDTGGVPMFPYADKVVHVTVFCLVAVAGVVAGIPRIPLAVALVAHAVVSEVVQATLLPGRSGSGLDTVADVVGIVLGLFLIAGIARYRRASVAPRSRG